MAVADLYPMGYSCVLVDATEGTEVIVSGSIGFAAAFAAGLVSFLSPCVLPLIPAYLSFMTGLTTAELVRRGSVYGPCDGSCPAVRRGLLARLRGPGRLGLCSRASSSFEYREVVEKIGGLLVVAFGILMLGIIKVPWLYGEARVDMGASRKFGRAAALVMGMSFAAGWTPCVGPILAAILGLAGTSGDVEPGALLLLAYSLGLGVPFLVVALLFDRSTPLLRWLNRHSLVINRVAGVDARSRRAADLHGPPGRHSRRGSPRWCRRCPV